MKIPRIVKYGGTNLAAFVFDFTLLLILDFIFFDIERLVIAFFCYISGTLVSYVLAKNFVFPKGWLDSKPTVEFSAYFLFGGVMGAVITALIFAILESLIFQIFLSKKLSQHPLLL